jgi:tetratricopeptide (TPR) repeat protein
MRLTAFLLCLGVGASALAQEEEQPPPPEEQSSIERARDHMERGQALYLQARFEEAAAEFEAAYQAQAFSAFLYNAGVALERAGQTQRAIEFFEQYLSRDPDASDARPVRDRIARRRTNAAAAAAR